MANCVYRLLCLDKNIKEFYIGSTADLKRRTGQHKYDCNNSNSPKHNFKVYTCIREHGGWDNWKVDIELLTTGMEKKDRLELEQNYIDCLKPDLNSKNALGHDRKETDKEYREKNKEYQEKNRATILERKKQYRENNKDKIKEYRKKYREDNGDKMKEQSKQYYDNNKEKMKEQHKEYLEDNKDKINEYRKKYREDNRDKMKEQSKQYYDNNKEKKKQYYLDNKEKIKSISRERYMLKKTKVI